MNDYLDQFTDEELDRAADTVIDMVRFAKTYVKNEKQEPLVVEWHQLLWLLHLELHVQVLIQGPRGHGKSSIFTTWMLYHVTHDQSYRFLIASHIEELADEFSQRIQSYLEPMEEEPPIGVPYIPRDFALAKGKKWSVGKAYFKGRSYPFVKTVAAKAGMTGGRFDAAVFDDPFTAIGIDSEKMRRKFKKWVQAAVIPSLDKTPKRKLVVIGTTKHIEDWYQDLRLMKRVASHIDQLYSYNEQGEKVYLWPAVPYPGEDTIKDHAFNEEREADVREMQDPQTFAMEMMNIAISAEGLMFKYEWIQDLFYDDWREEVPERFREIYMGIDPSLGGQDSDTSRFALVVICYDNRPHKKMIYIVDIVNEWISVGEQEDIILKKAREWNPIQINMEADLVNKDMADRMKHRLPIIHKVKYGFQNKTTGLRGTSTIDKKKRILQVAGMLFMDKKIRFRDPRICLNTRDFLNREYLQFPEGSLDGLDALNMAVDLVDFRKEIVHSPVDFF